MKRGMIIFLAVLFGFGCNPQDVRRQSQDDPKGKLFIIGGGKRPVAMLQRLIEESGVRQGGYVLILPLASAEEDTAAFYSSKQFRELGVDPIRSLNSRNILGDPDSVRSWIENASLIYLSGGSQGRFMERIHGTPVEEALKTAYRKGATIAGTSAGAAVMGRKMITGDQFKHPVYTGEFPTIEADNMELKEGLGLVEELIVDQHFIRRQRMNRLISVALEHPEFICVGIDESTALLFHGQTGEVIGESQIIVIQHPSGVTREADGLLGGTHLHLSVYLPGETIQF